MVDSRARQAGCVLQSTVESGEGSSCNFAIPLPSCSSKARKSLSIYPGRTIIPNPSNKFEFIVSFACGQVTETSVENGRYVETDFGCCAISLGSH